MIPIYIPESVSAGIRKGMKSECQATKTQSGLKLSKTKQKLPDVALVILDGFCWACGKSRQLSK